MSGASGGFGWPHAVIVVAGVSGLLGLAVMNKLPTKIAPSGIEFTTTPSPSLPALSSPLPSATNNLVEKLSPEPTSILDSPIPTNTRKEKHKKGETQKR